MEQLLFVAFIVIISIIDAIAKSQKKKQQRAEGIPEPEWEDSWATDDLPAYDAEVDDGRVLGGEGSASSSLEPYEGYTVVEPDPLEVEVRRVESIPARPDHRVHRAHAEYGTDPSSRRKSEQDDMDPLRETLGADARRARALLLAKDAHSLRQAIIVQEILSPPVALRVE